MSEVSKLNRSLGWIMLGGMSYGIGVLITPDTAQEYLAYVQYGLMAFGVGSAIWGAFLGVDYFLEEVLPVLWQKLIRILKFVFRLIFLPILLVFAIPAAIFGQRKKKRENLLFTGQEQRLIEKAERVMQTHENGLIRPDLDLVAVARLALHLREEYVEIKGREKFDHTYSEILNAGLSDLVLNNVSRVESYFDIEIGNSLDDDYTHYSSAEEYAEKDAAVLEGMVEALQSYISEFVMKHGHPPQVVLLNSDIHEYFTRKGLFDQSPKVFNAGNIVPYSFKEEDVYWKAG